MEKILEYVDFIFNKLMPKKLSVWIVATVLIFMDKIDGQMWGYISMIYLGANVAAKIESIFKKPIDKEPLK